MCLSHSTVTYRVQAYLVANPSPFTLPSLRTLAMIVQTILQQGRVGPFAVSGHQLNGQFNPLQTPSPLYMYRSSSSHFFLVYSNM